MKQPIDGAVIDFVSNVFLKSVPDLPHRRDLPALSLRKKGGEKFLLFFQRHILPSPPPCSCGFNRRDAETIVAGDHIMDGRFGHTAVPRDLLCLSRFNQGIVDNEPALPAKGVWVGPHPVFYFCQRQMGCCMGYSCHIFLLLSFQSVHSSSTR
jgi:hypothetical protein